MEPGARLDPITRLLVKLPFWMWLAIAVFLTALAAVRLVDWVVADTITAAVVSSWLAVFLVDVWVSHRTRVYLRATNHELWEENFKGRELAFVLGLQMHWWQFYLGDEGNRDPVLAALKSTCRKLDMVEVALGLALILALVPVGPLAGL